MNNTFKPNFQTRAAWYKDAGRTILHREHGPALIESDGTESWYLNGELHRVGGPAIISPHGVTAWKQHGKMHREDGPALIKNDGTEAWYFKGLRHREDGPAVVWGPAQLLDVLEKREWFWQGVHHNINGPAVIRVSMLGEKTEKWYLFGIKVSKDIFNEFRRTLDSYKDEEIKQIPYNVLQEWFMGMQLV